MSMSSFFGHTRAKKKSLSWTTDKAPVQRPVEHPVRSCVRGKSILQDAGHRTGPKDTR